MKKENSKEISSQSLRSNGDNTKTTSHTKTLEMAFVERKTGKEVTYIEEKGFAPETNHGSGIILSKFYKIEAGEKKELSEKQALSEMTGLMEICLSQESAEFTYVEKKYMSEGSVTYSY